MCFSHLVKKKKKSSESHLDDTLNHQPNDLCNQLSSSPRGMGHISFNWTTIPMRSLRCRVEFFWITDYPWSFNLLPWSHLTVLFFLKLSWLFFACQQDDDYDDDDDGHRVTSFIFILKVWIVEWHRNKLSSVFISKTFGKFSLLHQSAVDSELCNVFAQNNACKSGFYTHTHTSSGVKMKLWHVFKDVEPKKRKKERKVFFTAIHPELSPSSVYFINYYPHPFHNSSTMQHYGHGTLPP